MSKPRHRRLAGCLAAATFAALVGVPASAPAAGSVQPQRAVPATSHGSRAPYSNPNAAQSSARWILQAQLPNGAIATQLDHLHIWPYLGNLAALGLATARQLSGNQVYARAAWHWIGWYMRHEDPRTGFVTDYKRSHGRMRSTGTMDSTDAYAGTFLTATWATYVATHSNGHLAALAPGINGALKAIRRTTDTDGLTWAKPSWHVKYLMDEAETYAGLRAASNALAVLHHNGASHRAANAARRIHASIAKLWNPRTHGIDWAVHGDGAHQPTRWSILYPDGLEQAWAVAYGLVGGHRAAEIVDQLNRHQPKWDHPSAHATFDDGIRKVGYWAVAGWALLRVGRPAAASQAAATIARAALAAKKAWPFTPGDAGELSLLEAADLTLLPS
jgi:hypothetical protein